MFDVLYQVVLKSTLVTQLMVQIVIHQKAQPFQQKIVNKNVAIGEIAKYLHTKYQIQCAI